MTSHLTEIGCLPLLRIFDILHMPHAVWSETVGSDHVSEADVLELGSIQRITLSRTDVARFIEENGLEGLHIGECECVCLCQQTGVPILLTDDLAVRQAAKRLDLTPVGSLGVVAKAYRLQDISLTDAERHIVDLYELSSLFVTRAIVELAIKRLHERSERG